MSCVVCMDRPAHPNPSPPTCAQGCRGSQAVCEECMCLLEKCVYCRERVRSDPAEPIVAVIGVLAAISLFIDLLMTCAPASPPAAIDGIE